MKGKRIYMSYSHNPDSEELQSLLPSWVNHRNLLNRRKLTTLWKRWKQRHQVIKID